jgi:hypothetical protein
LNQKKNFIKTEKAFHDRLDCLATWPSYISIQTQMIFAALLHINHSCAVLRENNMLLPESYHSKTTTRSSQISAREYLGTDM